MSQYPNQIRTVDPFASYNSDTVNKITRVVTHGENALEKYDSLRGILDGTSIIVIAPGVIYKDDVRIQVQTSTIIDFKDAAFYENFGGGFDEDGYYYVLLEYSYEKSRPAPQAKFVILKPSQRSALSFSGTWVFLHAVRVQWNGSFHEVVDILDKDPQNIINQRRYIKVYAGIETSLPGFTYGYQGRVVYDAANDKFWFGYIDRWGEVGGGGTELSDINTSSVAIGDICRIDSTTGGVVATLSDDLTHQADLVCIKVGITDGKGLISGYVEEVPVETGILVGTGDLLYLSNSEAGKVTNVKPYPYYQLLGRALTNASSTVPVNMIFEPKLMMATNVEGYIDVSDWNGPYSEGYHANIDVRGLDGTSAFLIQIYDSATHEQIIPSKIEIINNGDYIRIWQPAPQNLDYVVAGSGGGTSGGGGGGGTVTDHDLLTNLSFAASGHTGFAPSPHGNGHHSQTYITASGVTFTNLNTNGSVGTGGSQVAFGNHTHAEFSNPSIPAGEMILFYKDTAVAGYNLITSVDDRLVYITKGSGAGGNPGGAAKPGSTWTQPSHSHSMPDHNHYYAHRHYVGIGNHQHSYSGTTSYESCDGTNRCSGGTNSHTHTFSGYTDWGGATTPISNYPYESYYTNYAGLTNTYATIPPDWRPRGNCFTIQQKI
jgi:hypothetical protein